MKLASILALAATLPLLLSCGNDDQDPEGAAILLATIRSEEYQTKYFRPAGFETKKPTTAPHGDEVEIFYNKEVENMFASNIKAAQWPAGAIIVKNGYEEGQLATISAMLKRDDGWFWAEWDASNDESLASGKPDLCTECHAEGGSDFVRAFKLPNP